MNDICNAKGCYKEVSWNIEDEKVRVCHSDEPQMFSIVYKPSAVFTS